MNICDMFNELNFLTEKLVDELKVRDCTIATAESCTGGMISSTIVNVPGASYVMNESYVTYSNEAKTRILGVRKETLDTYGAVSEETAKEMVLGVVRVALSDYAIAVTGIAGPDGGTFEKPVGTVYAGFYYTGTVEAVRYNFSGDRFEVRFATTKNVIEHMLGIIRKTEKNLKNQS